MVSHPKKLVFVNNAGSSVDVSNMAPRDEKAKREFTGNLSTLKWDSLFRPPAKRHPQSPEKRADLVTRPLMWLKQCHKPPMTGNGNHTTYIFMGGDWGMVYELVLSTLGELESWSFEVGIADDWICF